MKLMVYTLWFALAALSSAATLEVGPGKRFARPCEAIRAAAAGDTIEIAAGTYDGETCAIDRPRLTIRGAGNQRPHLRATPGRPLTQGKGIFVVSGTATGLTVENLEFSGATVPDRNGAGIRIDPGPDVTIRNCHFHDNEMGVLTGTGGSIAIEYSILENNGTGDGFSHNVYVNYAEKFVFKGNYSARCKVGQLVKSRAKETYILYNRLSQENGTGSREIDLSNGGRAWVIGNIIEQGPESQNRSMIGYQPEGLAAQVPDHVLYVVNNTFVNRAPWGKFVQINRTMQLPAVIRNNIFYGPGSITNQADAIVSNNLAGDPGFSDIGALDLTLRPGSLAIDSGAELRPGSGYPLIPESMYRHPACGTARKLSGIIDMGAFEHGGAGGMEGPARCLEPKAAIRVVHGATLQAGPLAPGAVAALMGEEIPADSRVAVNDIDAPVLFASPAQVNFQVPYETALGGARVELRATGEPPPGIAIEVKESAPGIFLDSGGVRAIVERIEGGLLAVFLTGQGPLSRPLAAGEASPDEPRIGAALPASASIGGREVAVRSLFMAPGLIGVARAEIEIPADLEPGEHLLSIRIGDSQSNAAAVTAP
jgi:uncharacterized protein (TIGR03437 family)